MNKTSRIGARLLVLLAISLAFCGSFLPRSSVSAQSTNLLVNGGFEGEYVTVPGGYAAPGWTTHYRQNTAPPLQAVGGGSDPTRRPEFKPIDAEQYPSRVAEGQTAQVAFAFYGIMDAAFSQQIQVGAGNDVQFSIQGHGWASNTDNPAHNTGDVHLSLCIAAEGQTWPWSHGVECTRYDWTPGEYRTYYSRVVTAQSDAVTIIVLVTNKWALKHNDIYLDDAWAWIVADSCPECPPCATPEPCPDCPDCPTGGDCDENAIAQAVVSALRDWFSGLRWGVVD